MTRPDEHDPPYGRHAEDRDGASRWRVRFSPDISFGQGINGILFAAAAFFSISTYFAKVDTAQRDVKTLQSQVQELRADMTGQFADMHANLAKQIDLVRADIVALPDVRAQMTMLSREQTATDNRIDAQSARLEQLQQTEIEDRADVKSLRSDVDALKRAGENAPIRVPR